MGPQKTVKALSNEQEEAIRNLIREEARRVRNTQGRGREGAVDHEEFPAPEVYVALVPHGGIAAVTVGEFETGTGTGTGTGTTFGDDVPGSAICQIYYLHDDGTLKMIDGEVKRVYNANRVRVQAGSWVIVVRDKLETWWVVGPVIGGESTAVSVCEELTVVTNVCIDWIGTGTSGEIDAILVEYSTYDLTSCELIDRYCLRNPTACCLTCSTHNLPELIYATFSSTAGCTCANGLELTLRYDGIATSGPGSGLHKWTSGVQVAFGSCTGRFVVLDLYLHPTFCTWTFNLYVANQTGTDICHNNYDGMATDSWEPLALHQIYGVGSGDGISCTSCTATAGHASNNLRIDFTE